MIAYVYLMQAGEFCKIGWSYAPEARRRQLDTGPIPLTLLHAFPSQNACKVERSLHARFTATRVRLEWFRLTVADIDLIRQVKCCHQPDGLPQLLQPPQLPVESAKTPQTSGRWLEGRTRNVRVFLTDEEHEAVRKAAHGTRKSMSRYAIEAAIAAAKDILGRDQTD